MDSTFDQWTAQVRRGVLDLGVLNALRGGERYGYELVRSLAESPSFGVAEGTLYPLLARLRAAGLVTTRLEESKEGPARKYYALTTQGRRAASLMERHLEQMLRSCRELRGAGEAS
jgi:PadR family transcriptional regulator, regulatory protein PadR